MATLSTADLLQRVPLFQGLSEALMNHVVQSMEKRTFKRSELIIEAQTRVNSLIIILSGQVRVFVVGDGGRQAVMATLGPSECLGEMSIIDGEPHSASVIADTAVDALILSQAAFSECIHSSPQFAVSILRSLVGRLRNANQKMASLAYVSVFGRVAQYLIDSATESETGDLLVRRKLSQAEMSKTLGASREMISQAMKTFESQLFIEKLGDGKIRVNSVVLQNRPDLVPGLALNLHQCNRSYGAQGAAY